MTAPALQAKLPQWVSYSRGRRRKGVWKRTRKKREESKGRKEMGEMGNMIENKQKKLDEGKKGI